MFTNKVKRNYNTLKQGIFFIKDNKDDTYGLFLDA